MGLEVECKVYTPDLAAIQTRLQNAGAVIVGARVLESNIRYENAEKDLVDRGIVLRLRRDREVRLTYKAPAQQMVGASARQEFETTVGDFETMHAILQFLDFRPYMVYEKYRTTYEISDIAHAEIMLDEMPYGVFIEVEGTSEAIDTVLAKLELAGEPRILNSYAYIFDRVRVHYRLKFRDLTFANFAGLQIDLHGLLD